VPAVADIPASGIPTSGIPTPLERALLLSTISPAALSSTTEATGRPEEVQRAEKIVAQVLDRTEGQEAPEVKNHGATLADIRRDYRLGLSDDQLAGALVTSAKAERLAAYQAATESELSQERLERLDDDLFWASFDPDRGAPSQEFVNEDGSAVLVEIDPDTRDTTVSIFNDEEGLPFNLALPTRWVPAGPKGDAPPDNDDLMSSGTGDAEPEVYSATDQSPSQEFSDDLFAMPEPVADPDHKPRMITASDREEVQLQLNGMWVMDGFRYSGPHTWFIATQLGTDNLIRPAKSEAQGEVDRIEADLARLADAKPAHVWRNLATGEEVRQEKYKRLDIDTWDYLGQSTEESQAAERDRLEAELASAQSELAGSVTEASETIAGFDEVAKRGGAIRVRQLGACGYVMDEAYFDGLNLVVRDAIDEWCKINPDVPDGVKRQLIGNQLYPWTAVFRIIPDPRSDNLILRGKSWGGKVHYETTSLKVQKLTGPHPYAAPFGTRPKEDENTLLTGSAMGAEDDENI